MSIESEKHGSFLHRDYNWREEIERRKEQWAVATQQWEQGLDSSRREWAPDPFEPFGNSPLLEQGARRLTGLASEFVFEDETWGEAIDTFAIEGFSPEREHRGEFDFEARVRMIRGSRWLMPLLIENIGLKTGSLLELGPFANPLARPDFFPQLDITYVDNEKNILEYLEGKFPQTEKIIGNLSELDSIQALQGRKFDFMIMSQIFNYLDFRKLLKVAKDMLNSGGDIFINNVAHYGIPEYFAPEDKRPNSEWDTLQALEDFGFDIPEWIVMPPWPNHPPLEVREHQPLDRLLAVARKK